MPYGPVIAFLGIYPTEIKIYIHIKTGTGIFVLALFVIIKNYKQPKIPSMDEWLNKTERPFYKIPLSN